MENENIKWLNRHSRTFLERDYLLPSVTPEQRMREIAENAERILGEKGFADKFESYLHKGWFSMSTPIWTNFGVPNRGLDISCFNSYIPDCTADILSAISEVGIMTKQGGGTSGYFGDLRPRGSAITGGGVSNGAVSFMQIFDTCMDVISQSARRGNFAAYLPIDHGDIEEFLQIRSEGHPIQNLSIGVTIPDGWMQSMIDGDTAKRKIWTKVIKKRCETGYPYIFFSDNVNNGKPQVYKDKNLTILGSNLCAEVLLPSCHDESFVCDLSSLNVFHYDEWKDTDAVHVLTYFLDAVMTEFIERARTMPHMQRAVKFAERHRAIGIGVLGLHSYYQSKMVPFEGMAAKRINNEIFKLINDKSLEASRELAVKFGEPDVLKGYGERMTCRMSIAPTTSSSFILGQVSPSVEPLHSNYFMKDLAKGKFVYKNPELKKLLKHYKKNDEATWTSILMKGGSVQHLNFLTEEERDVFKTFGEISQLEIIQQAAQRQQYIDQGQSLNLMIHPDASPKEINKLMISAWELGIKTLYYQRSANVAQEVGRKLMECKSCES